MARSTALTTASPDEPPLLELLLPETARARLAPPPSWRATGPASRYRPAGAAAFGGWVAGVRAICWAAGCMAGDGWGRPAGGGKEISMKSPPVWISAPAAAAAAARSAVGAGAETGLAAGCAPGRGRRERVRP